MFQEKSLNKYFMGIFGVNRLIFIFNYPPCCILHSFLFYSHLKFLDYTSCLFMLRWCWGLRGSEMFWAASCLCLGWFCYEKWWEVFEEGDGVAMRNSWNIYVARLALANWPKWCRIEILCVSELLLKSSEIKILVSSDAGSLLQHSSLVLALKAETFISSVFFLKIILKPQEENLLCWNRGDAWEVTKE